jgi:hypothetical protein
MAGACDGSPAVTGPADAVPTPTLLVPGRVELVGDGDSSCTNQLDHPGQTFKTVDRWCAFRRSGGRSTELWVIDVSKALAGTVPRCDGSSPLCLRLTDALWTDESFLGPRQSQAHRFEGDTLIFHAGASSGPPDAPYAGPVWAWRPGWSSARRLAAHGYDCFAHPSAALALCMDEVGYEVTTPVEFDLRAGRLDDAGGDLLPVVDRPRLSVAERHHEFRMGFSPDGQHLVYTNGSTVDAPTPALRVRNVADLATVPPRDLLTDVMQWELSLDGTKIFYLTDYDDPAGVGRLTAADFPSGAHVQSSPFRTSRFVVVAGAGGEDRGIGVFLEPGGPSLSEYRLITDRDALSHSQLVFRYPGPLEDFAISADARYVGYAKADPAEGFNGYVVRSDGTRECILNGERDRPAVGYSFLPSSALIFWAEESPDTSTQQDGWLADPEGCGGRQLFAHHVAFYTPVGDRGLIFGDALDLATNTFQLEYAALEAGARWPARGAVRVHDQVGFPLALLAPAVGVVFPVRTDTEATSGLFLVGPLPGAPGAR